MDGGGVLKTRTPGCSRLRAYNIFALLDWYLRHPIPGFKVFLFDLINGWLFLRSPGFLLWDTIALVGSFDGCLLPTLDKRFVWVGLCVGLLSSVGRMKFIGY